MRPRICDRLLGYLDDALPAAKRRQFVDHLEHCFTCRQALEEHRLVEQLLVRAADETVPEDLLARIERQILGARRKRLPRRMIAVAAAVLVIGTATWVAQRPALRDVRVERPVVANATRGPAQEPPSAAVVDLRGPPDAVAVPVKSHDPKVTIVWIFSSPNSVADNSSTSR